MASLRQVPKKIWLAGVVLIPLVVVCVQIFSLARFAFTPGGISDQNKVVVQVVQGHNPWKLSTELQSKGVISDAKRFHSLGRWIRKWRSVKIGEYEFEGKLTPIEVFSILTSGISVQHRLTIPEGSNMYQIADQVAALGLATREEFLDTCRDKEFIRSLHLGVVPPTLEGYLYPETYFFNRALSVKGMIRQMVRNFLANWTPELEAGAKKLRMSRHEVTILASIIEKETGAPEERPMISSVFHQRLKTRMRLGSDPTTIYGIWEHFDGNLRRRHLRQKNDYNTYSFVGLPKGPIANPGKEALAAAVNPAPGDYLYFVSKNDGTHAFSRTLKEHEAAIRTYQLNSHAREGKSWRDRLKKAENNR